jgi:hypothetical protein
MTLTTDQIIIVALAAVVLLLLGYLVGSRGRRGSKAGQLPVALPPGAEALAPAFGELRTQLGDLQGKVEQLRLTDAAAESRRGLEDQAWQAIQHVDRSLTSLLQLPTLQQSLQDQVAGAVRDLAAIRELQAVERQRWTIEDDAFASLRRLATAMLGSATSGAAGERVVEQVLEGLPAQWRVADHTVNGKRVEFAIRLPDGLLLPIDSKVVAQNELRELDGTEDRTLRDRLEGGIRTKVLQRAAEVSKYVDARSPGFAVAAIPDAVFRVCGPVLARAYQEHRALLVPYSLLAPFVLMVYEQHLRSGLDLDNARLARLLADAQAHLDHAQQELNGRLGGALVQLGNGRDALARELAEAGHALALLRGAAAGGSDGKSR